MYYLMLCLEIKLWSTGKKKKVHLLFITKKQMHTFTCKSFNLKNKQFFITLVQYYFSPTPHDADT